MVESDRNGRELVDEQGLLPGIELRTRYAGKQWRIEAGAEAYASTIDYDGQTQGGSAFSTDTKTRQLRAGVEFGRHITSDTLLIAGIEHDYWKRHIVGQSGTLGMKERYSSWRLLVGGETGLLQTAWANVRLKGLLVASTPEKLAVRFENRLFDDARLRTRSATGARIALDTRLTQLPGVGVEADFEWMRIDRSKNAILRLGGAPVGTLAQPEHVRKAFGVKLKYQF